MTESKRFQILVCDGPSCGISHESELLVEHIEQRAGERPGLLGRVECTPLTCFGRCDEGPNLLVRELEAGEDGSIEPDFDKLLGARGLYLGMDTKKIDKVLEEHIEQDRPVDGWVETYD